MVVDDDEYDDFHAPNGVEPETRVLLFFFSSLHLLSHI